MLCAEAAAKREQKIDEMIERRLEALVGGRNGSKKPNRPEPKQQKPAKEPKSARSSSSSEPLSSTSAESSESIHGAKKKVYLVKADLVPTVVVPMPADMKQAVKAAQAAEAEAKKSSEAAKDLQDRNDSVEENDEEEQLVRDEQLRADLQRPGAWRVSDATACADFAGAVVVTPLDEVLERFTRAAARSPGRGRIDELYYCGGAVDVAAVGERGFSREHFTPSPFGEALRFCREPESARAATGGSSRLLLCMVFLGNLYPADNLSSSKEALDRLPRNYNSVLTRPRVAYSGGAGGGGGSERFVQGTCEYLVFDAAFALPGRIVSFHEKCCSGGKSSAKSTAKSPVKL